MDIKSYRSEIERNFPDLKKFSEKSDLDFLTIFITSKLNNIDSRPRSVLASPELNNSKYYNLFESEILEIKNKFEHGESLSENLTKRNVADRDFLLRDLGIYHLHLSNLVKEDQKTERTDELLLVYLEDCTAYFIDIATHEELFKKGFRQRTKFLEIMDRNW